MHLSVPLLWSELHAWDHPATFLGCVQVRSMRFWGDYVSFGEGSASVLRQKEGVTRIYESKRRRPTSSALETRGTGRALAGTK